MAETKEKKVEDPGNPFSLRQAIRTLRANAKMDKSNAEAWVASKEKYKKKGYE